MGYLEPDDMMSQKRRLPLEQNLQRRVKARRQDDESDISFAASVTDAGSFTEGDEASDSLVDGGVTGSSDSGLSTGDENGNGSERGADEDGESESGQETLQADLGSISFGALAQAQESLRGQSRGRGSSSTEHSRTKRAALLQKLREARSKKDGPRDGGGGDDKSPSNPASSTAHPSAPGAVPHRTNKHAPMEISSKKAVSRKRKVVEMPKPEAARDPRFESLTGPPISHDKLRKNYSFLEQYREAEMKQLAESIKKTKDVETKALLKRQLLSMESRKQAQERKDKEQEILRAHRSREKELVKEGKKPYYLKKGEQKKLALIDRYQQYVSNGNASNNDGNAKPNDKSRDQQSTVEAAGAQKGAGADEGKRAEQTAVNKKLERVLERRRRKNAAKERKMMPFSRRHLQG